MQSSTDSGGERSYCRGPAQAEAACTEQACGSGRWAEGERVTSTHCSCLATQGPVWQPAHLPQYCCCCCLIASATAAAWSRTYLFGSQHFGHNLFCVPPLPGPCCVRATLQIPVRQPASAGACKPAAARRGAAARADTAQGAMSHAPALCRGLCTTLKGGP
eukprot:365664-Chlamydomonas_euryale.AAC.5